MYDPEQDIRTFYREAIKALNAQIEATDRRDPILHKLHAERRDLGNRLRAFADIHIEPQGALAHYGAW